MPVLENGEVRITETGFTIMGFLVTEMVVDELAAHALDWAIERLTDEVRKRAEIEEYQGKYTIRFEAAP